MATSIVSNSTAATFGNSPQKTGEPVDRLSIYSGKALEFDGVSDFIEPKQGSTYWQPSTHDKMTFAVWIKTTGGGDIFEGGGRNYTAFRIYGQSNVLKVELNSTGIHSDTTIIDDGAWHRIVVSFDKDASSNQVNIYVDGKLSTSHTNTSAISGLNNSNSVHYPMIGANSSNLSDNVWGGLMADFQYWTEAWNLEDVTYDYLHPEKLITTNSSATSSIASSSLELWYPMNDTGITNPQTVIFDAAGTNNTTKAHGTTTFLGDELFDAAAADGSDASYWTSGGGGGVTVDSGAIKITNDSNTFIRFRDSGALSEDLEVGATYRLTADIKVNTGSISWYISGPNVFLIDGLTATDFTTTTVDFVASHATNNYLKTSAMDAGEEAFIDNLSLKKIGIASGWTDADQQQYIPQTAFMDGCVKLVGPENNSSNASPHFTLDSTGTTTSGTAYSVSAWLMRTTTPGATDNYLLSTAVAHDRIYFPSATQVGWLTDGTGTTINLGVTLEANVWEFWTFVSDSGTKRIYRNAQELATSSQSPSNGFDYSHIGVWGASESASCFEGIIDELAIWDTVLSPTEVAELYNNGLPLNATKHSKYTTSASNLKAYWKNNHLNSDGKMKDQVGSNHATITETGDSFEKIFFQQGVTANLCTQGYSNNIVQPSKGAVWFSGSGTTTGTSSYADIGKDIEIEGDFMVMFWFKVPNTSINYLFGYGNNDFFRISDEDTFQLKINGTNENINLNGGTDIGVEQWHHIALTRTGATGVLKIYFDNVEQTATSATDTSTLKIRALMRKGTSSSNFGYGMIDDFFVYDNFNENAINKNYKHGKSQHKNS